MVMGMSYKLFFRLGVVFCCAAGIPLVILLIPKLRGGSSDWAFWALCVLCCFVFDLIDAFKSKGELIPPCVPVKKPGPGRVARTANGVASFMLCGFVLYFAATGSFPFLGHMSGWDMLGCGFFTMAAIIYGFLSLFQKVEIYGNGLLDRVGSQPKLRPWEAYESFSWAEETQDCVELRLQSKSAGPRTTRLMVRPEDRDVVQQILEANLPDQLSGAHGRNDRRIPPPCVRVRRSRRRLPVRQVVSVLCWPAVVLLLVYLWQRNTSWETFSFVGCLSIMITAGVNFRPPEKIVICGKGLLLNDELRPWGQYYECFFWKGETKDGAELRLPLKYWITESPLTRLVVAPEDREAVQQILEANLPDRSMDSGRYSGWSLSLQRNLVVDCDFGHAIFSM